MAKRWTPRRFVALRRLRIMISAVVVVIAFCVTFMCTARKSVALNVNGEIHTVTTYATTVSGLLREQHIDVKTHDLVESASEGGLVNNDVVTVKSAYQTTITIDGQEVPFWTVADSAEQLLGFFEANEVAASRVSVDIKNVYNQLTGGMIINADGPVTVIADGKESIAPNGKLPAASILDSKSIVLNKDDRVSVSKEDGKTILRVERVTYDEETTTEEIAYTTRTVVDSSLQPGETRVLQEGVNGEKQITYKITYVDGKEESRTQTGETVTRVALDQVIAVGPEAPAPSDNSSADSETNTEENNDSQGDPTEENNDANASPTPEASETAPSQQPSTETTTPTQQPTQQPTQKPTQQPTQTPTQQPQPTQPTQTPTPQPTQTPTQQPQKPSDESSSAAGSRLYRPTIAAAQAYAAGAAAQYGWTGQNWEDLVKLWNRESGWRWNAENPWSGAYGIPQALPANKMAAFGANYRDDAAAQIDWGLNYIAGRYGTPSKAWEHSEKYNWY